MLAPHRQCPVSLLACLVPPCPGTCLSPHWLWRWQGWGTQSVAGPLATSPSGNAWHSESRSPHLLGMGGRLVCLLRDAGLHEPSEPYFQLSLWLDVSSPLLNSPSRMPLVLWHSTQCSCSGLASDILCHADRSDSCQALPTDVTGIICLAEQGMHLHQTVQ